MDPAFGQRILQNLRDIVLERIGEQPIKVFLFGSWARQEQKDTSDIDLALEATAPLSPQFLCALKDALEDSTIPFCIDIVDLATCDPQIREQALKEGIPWNA